MPAASWIGLVDLHERLADSWTLIGGQELVGKAAALSNAGDPGLGRLRRNFVVRTPIAIRLPAADRTDRTPSPGHVTGRVLWDARSPAGGLASDCRRCGFLFRWSGLQSRAAGGAAGTLRCSAFDSAVVPALDGASDTGPLQGSGWSSATLMPQSQCCA